MLETPASCCFNHARSAPCGACPTIRHDMRPSPAVLTQTSPVTPPSNVQACPSSCLHRNERGESPADVAVTCERGEVLNAMLLACSGDAGEAAVTSMRKLLLDGGLELFLRAQEKRGWSTHAVHIPLHHMP